MTAERVDCDILIIGGGTAGCYAAIRLAGLWGLGIASESGAASKSSPRGGVSHRIVIADKADIRRSGCLAAGVNALNAYIGEGHTPRDYVDYAAADASGIVRYDLLESMAERLNAVTADLEDRGLAILKDEDGRYVTRGWRIIHDPNPISIH